MARIAVEGERSIYYEQYAGPRAARDPDPRLGHELPGLGHDARQPAGKRATRSLTFDQRGCGQSDKDFEENSIERSAGDVAALAKHLGLSRAVVNGWSLGGAIAVAAAARLGSDLRGRRAHGRRHAALHTGAPTSRTAARPAALRRPSPLLRADRANFLWV